MESRKSIEDFLREVDEDLIIYAGELRSNGFTSTASAKYLTENDLAGIPEGHKRLILNMVSRLRTPVRERPQTKFPSFSEKSPASKSPARKKTVLSAGEASVGQEAQWKTSKFDTWNSDVWRHVKTCFARVRSRVDAIDGTFEIYGWKFWGHLILIWSFRFCTQNFSKVNFVFTESWSCDHSHAKSLLTQITMAECVSDWKHAFFSLIAVFVVVVWLFCYVMLIIVAITPLH